MNYETLERPNIPQKLKDRLAQNVRSQAEAGLLHPVVRGVVQVLKSPNPKIHPVRMSSFLAAGVGGESGVFGNGVMGAMEVGRRSLWRPAYYRLF